MGAQFRFRHTGKFRKLVDDPAQIPGLADDHIGILLQRFRLIANHRGKLAFQPFGGQLDRGQRVLDFMGNPASHIAPCGHSLGGNQIGDIIKGNHIALEPPIVIAPCANPHQQVFQLALAGQFDFFLHHFGILVAQFLQQRAEFRHSHGNIAAVFIRQRQQPFGRPVYKGDLAIGIHPDNPRRNRGQHGIKQPPAAFNLSGVFQQRIALPFQLFCHLVEIAPKHGDFIVAGFFHDLHIQIPRPYLLRRPCQTAHRARQAFGKPQAQPDRRQNKDHRKTDIQKAEFKQHLAAIFFQLLV